MGRMATHTDRHLRIPELSQTPTMNGSVVLSHLVDTKRGVVLLHEPAVGVAASAELSDLFSFRLTDVAPGRIHRLHSGFARVAAVAGNAAESLGGVNILGIIPRRDDEAVNTRCQVAGRTILGLLLRRER